MKAMLDPRKVPSPDEPTNSELQNSVMNHNPHLSGVGPLPTVLKHQKMGLEATDNTIWKFLVPKAQSGPSRFLCFLPLGSLLQTAWRPCPGRVGRTTHARGPRKYGVSNTWYFPKIRDPSIDTKMLMYPKFWETPIGLGPRLVQGAWVEEICQRLAESDMVLMPLQGSSACQRARYPFIQEYTLNGTRVPNMI